MAAAAPLSTPARQPFGSVSNARLRNLGNTKNKQNALCTTTTKSNTSSTLKSAPPQTFNDIDSENIDPSILTSSKSSKNHQSLSDLKSSTSSANMHHFRAASLFPKARAPAFQLATTGGQKRKASVLEGFAAPHTDRRIKTVRTRPLEEGSNLAQATAIVAALPDAARPAPAGRSPKSKRIGILSRHRVSARVDPPSFNNGLPSIDAALSGTIRSYKPNTPSILDQIPKGWAFNIHEDSKDEHDSIMMEHSTCTLDLSSDDEDRVKARDDRGKENIPPSEGLNAPVVAARSDIMTDGADDARPALATLNPVDYYAPGVGADDHFLVPAEGSNQDSESNINQLTTANIGDFLSAANTAAAAVTDTPVDIWESESAKAENEVAL